MELGQPVRDTGEGGHGSEDVGTFIPEHCTGRTDIFLGYMGGYPLHWEGTGGGVSPLGRTAYFGQEIMDTRQQYMGLPPTGGGHEGGGPGGYGYLSLYFSLFL